MYKYKCQTCYIESRTRAASMQAAITKSGHRRNTGDLIYYLGIRRTKHFSDLAAPYLNTWPQHVELVHI